jgi:RimJ/RimL family protein N-acetyltransferase
MSKINLPAAMLAKRVSLPEKPSSVILEGQFIRLEPLVIERDVQRLFEISNGNALRLRERSINPYDADELIWRYMLDGPFKNIEELATSLHRQESASNGRCMCVFDIISGLQVGVVNLINNFPFHLKIELGGIWYSPIVQKTSANTEATYLMLKHCFELGYRRVEWKCHSLNDRSCKAALRMGFKFEGIQESHMIVKDCNRDTAWFRMLEGEWAEVKQNLEHFLY